MYLQIATNQPNASTACHATDTLMKQINKLLPENVMSFQLHARYIKLLFPHDANGTIDPCSRGPGKWAGFVPSTHLGHAPIDKPRQQSILIESAGLTDIVRQ